MPYMKTEPPTFRPDERPEERIGRLGDFLGQHWRELDYILTHLNGQNMGAGFSVPVRNMAGEEIGSLGYTANGIGISNGAAVIEARADGILLTAGKIGLRITEAGIEHTTDGETWTPLAEEEAP